jgi:hypothetical protein
MATALVAINASASRIQWRLEAASSALSASAWSSAASRSRMISAWAGTLQARKASTVSGQAGTASPVARARSHRSRRSQCGASRP